MPSLAKASPRHQSPTRRRSVNLEYDHGADEHGRPFIVTACARRAIQRIAEGVSASSTSRAWTLTGPFGTGKSSFALFLSRLLSPPSSPHSKQAHQLLDRADPSLHAALRANLPVGTGLIPIVITGAREPLSAALVRGLVTALEASSARGAKRVANEIRDGATDGRRDPLKLLDQAVSALVSAADGAGALIVIDELGKLLEYAAANPARSDVYLLQRLAEHVARAPTPTLLIGVLHQDFSGYSQELSEVQRQEWEKVRGRFEDIIFEQSADDMLRLIADAMSSSRAVVPGLAQSGPDRILELCKRAWETKVVPPGFQIAEGLPVLAACHPLHPCVTLLLGAVFKRFGQNERSAFSFLSSGEPHALVEFAKTVGPDDLYQIVHLYQYLTSAFGDALIASKDGKRWAEALSVEAQHPDLTADELSVLRTIALLGIVGRWNGVAPTAEVLQFALAPSLSASDITAAIKSLLAKSAIVLRRFNGTYNLWEGSDIDVEARIADARSRIAADASTVQLLRAHFTPRPLVARRHSFESGTLRYFDVAFATGKTLDQTLTAFDNRGTDTSADGQIIVLLPDGRGGSADPSDSTIQTLATRSDTLLCVPGNAREIETLARELSAVQWVQHATADLQSDATARRELAARDEDVRRRVEQAVAEVLTPTRPDVPRTRWFYKGKWQKLATPRALNELLSRICDDVFPDAPIIQNEIINRRELSSSAAAAQGNLIARMLNDAAVDGLRIEGNPPERSIYLSVLLALKLHQERNGQWLFVSSNRSVRKDAQPVYKAITTFFSEAAAGPRPLDILFDQLRRPPFGLRNGVIPILVCAALLGHEADVAVYEDGAFLPQLTDALFEKLVKEPSRYTVRRWQVNGVRLTVFEHLARMLGQSHIAGDIEPRDLLDVVKPLVRFVRKLPVFTRQTKTFAPVTVAVREAIVNASEPDQLLFHDLPAACGIKPFSNSRKDRSDDIAAFLRVLQRSLAELQRGYESLIQAVATDLAKSLDLLDRDSKHRQHLRTRAAAISGVALNPEVKVFSARLADSVAEDSTWLEQIAAFLANKHPTLWHDDDRGRFAVRLQQLTDAFKGLEAIVVSRRQLSREDEQCESIRISVVSTHAPQTDHVVHVSKADIERIQQLESQLSALVRPYAANGSRQLAIAALARIAQSVLQPDATDSALKSGSLK